MYKFLIILVSLIATLSKLSAQDTTTTCIPKGSYPDFADGTTPEDYGLYLDSSQYCVLKKLVEEMLKYTNLKEKEKDVSQIAIVLKFPNLPFEKSPYSEKNAAIEDIVLYSEQKYIYLGNPAYASRYENKKNGLKRMQKDYYFFQYEDTVLNEVEDLNLMKSNMITMLVEAYSPTDSLNNIRLSKLFKKTGGLYEVDKKYIRQNRKYQDTINKILDYVDFVTINDIINNSDLPFLSVEKWSYMDNFQVRKESVMMISPMFNVFKERWLVGNEYVRSLYLFPFFIPKKYISKKNFAKMKKDLLGKKFE